MAREIVRHELVTVRKAVYRYTCDSCGEVCGTRANPKKTWYRTGGGQSHYCMRTCRPRDRATREGE